MMFSVAIICILLIGSKLQLVGFFGDKLLHL